MPLITNQTGFWARKISEFFGDKDYKYITMYSYPTNRPLHEYVKFGNPPLSIRFDSTVLYVSRNFTANDLSHFCTEALERLEDTNLKLEVTFDEDDKSVDFIFSQNILKDGEDYLLFLENYLVWKGEKELMQRWGNTIKPYTVDLDVLLEEVDYLRKLVKEE